MKYRKYNNEIYTTIKCADLYLDYREWTLRYKYEAFSYQNFEYKIIEDNKYGIIKCIDRNKFKIFKFNKELFEYNIAKYDNFEELELIDDDSEFIDDNE